MTIVFRPTILTIIVVMVFTAFCIFHVPLAAAWPVMGLSTCLSFMFFQFGKISLEKQSISEKHELKLRTEAVQLEALLDIPDVALFPDIQFIIVEIAAEKYEMLGEQEYADSLRAGKTPPIK